MPQETKSPQFKQADGFEDIYKVGAPTGMTGDIDSILYRLPGGKIMVAGLREQANPAEIDRVVGPDVLHLMLHGGSLTGDLKDYKLGTPIVAHNGDKVDEKTSWLYVDKPADWPKRGLDITKYSSHAEQNYVKLANVITEQNPTWIIAANCNEVGKIGVTPRYFMDMNLRPDAEKRTRYVAMNTPGFNGYSGCMSSPVMCENDPAMNSPHLYEVIKNKDSKIQGYEDRGTFLFNGEYLDQPSVIALEEMQVGPATKLRMDAKNARVSAEKFGGENDRERRMWMGKAGEDDVVADKICRNPEHLDSLKTPPGMHLVTDKTLKEGMQAGNLAPNMYQVPDIRGVWHSTGNFIPENAVGAKTETRHGYREPLHLSVQTELGCLGVAKPATPGQEPRIP
jgi:hypothetical protein